MGNYNRRIKAVLESLLIGMPGVKLGQAFGYPAFKVEGKIFAFVGEQGVALKLPRARVQELIAAGTTRKQFAVGDGIVWREWLSIEHTNPDDYEQDMNLFEESVQFVVS